ncbi:MAG: AI-2E family transporter [Desulfomonilaceae bacterium]
MTIEGKRNLIRIGAGLSFFIIMIWLISALESITTVLLVAFFLAYILDPLVERLTSWGLGRSSAASIILLSGLSIVVGLLLFVVPVIIEETGRFADALPRYGSAFHDQVTQLAARFGVRIPQDWDQVINLIVAKGRQYLPKIANISADALLSLFKSTVHILSTLLHILLVPIITYYLLVSFADIRREIRDLIPPYTRGPVIQKLREIDQVLAGFIRGQLTICLILAALYSLGFVVIRIDLAVVLGLISGIFFIIPYVGTMIGIVFGSLMAWAKYGDLLHVAYVLGWIGIVQLFEAYFFTPRIVGHITGLHPVVYILALIAGASLFGFVGLLVAIPVTAVLQVLLVTAIDAYKNSYLYHELPNARSEK